MHDRSIAGTRSRAAVRDGSGDRAEGEPLSRDRVFDAFKGRTREELGDTSARHLEWLAAECIGPRVLVLGAAEGALSILLARQGFDVVGLSDTKEAAEAAARLSREEAEPVRARLRFVEQIRAQDAPDLGVFDTALLDGDGRAAAVDPLPEPILRAVRPVGRVLISVPCVPCTRDRRGASPPHGGPARSAPWGEDTEGRLEAPDIVTPRALVDLLRPRVFPRSLEYEDGRLLFVGVRDAPTEEAWESIASGARLLDLSEEILRDQVARGLSRLRASEGARNELIRYIARNPRKSEIELKDVRRRLADRERALERVFGTTIYQLGSAIVSAARPSAETFRLPIKLLEIYRTKEVRSQRSSAASGTQLSEQAASHDVEPRRRALEVGFRDFATRSRLRGDPRLVVMFSGTSYLQTIRANRPIRMTRVLIERGIPVYFSYHGAIGDRDRPRSEDESELLFQAPVDFTTSAIGRLVSIDVPAARKVFIVSYPHRSVPGFLNRLNTNGWVTIYDCRDDWEEFAKAGDMGWYSRAAEKFILNNVDLVFAVSRPLSEKLMRLTGTRDVRLCPNAYDRRFLSPGYAPAPAAKIKIGYFGYLTPSWFDWESLNTIARARPDYQFEIIGDGAPRDVRLAPNVRLFGPKEHAEICQLAREWRAAIIPFKISKLADAVDPIKIYEYFALGLPVVSFRMPQIDGYPYTTTVSTAGQFVEALDQAVRMECDRNVFGAFLERNTWEHRVDAMLDAADQVELEGFEKRLHEDRTRHGGPGVSTPSGSPLAVPRGRSG